MPEINPIIGDIARAVSQSAATVVLDYWRTGRFAAQQEPTYTSTSGRLIDNQYREIALFVDSAITYMQRASTKPSHRTDEMMQLRLREALAAAAELSEDDPIKQKLTALIIAIAKDEPDAFVIRQAKDVRDVCLDQADLKETAL